jgi:hypothetical protein
MLVGGKHVARSMNTEDDRRRLWRASGYDFARIEDRGLDMVRLFFKAY